MEDPIVTIDDIRKTGHCVKGIRRWFEAYGLDFRQFISTGIRASELEATGDQLAFEVVSKIKGRNSNG